MGYRNKFKKYINMKKLYIIARRTMYILLGEIQRIFFKTKPLISILCYHSISNDGWTFSTRLDEFERQIKYLSSEYQFISLKEVCDHVSNKKPVTVPSIALTFDDGYKNILSLKQIIKKYSLKPTVFLIADREHTNRKEIDTKLELLNHSDVVSMLKDGWEIGSHTSTHPDVSLLSKSEIQYEIIESKSILEKEFSTPIKYIAYPKGAYNNHVLQAVKTARYQMGLSMDDGIVSVTTNPLAIPRVGVDGSHSFAEFKSLFLPLNIKLRSLIKKVI